MQGNNREMEKESQQPLAVHVISLGCAKNLVDTEVMCGTLITEGFCLAEEPEDADIVLVNTCGFIKDARKEAEDSLQWALEWKGRSRKKMVIAAGCLVQRDAAGLAQKYPGIDLFIGLDEIALLPQRIRDARANKALPPLPSGMPTYLYDDTVPRLTLTPPVYGYVKIAEGCDHRCAYCAIPLFRGNQRSRTEESVLRECHQLLDQGARELLFIAQDTSRYGAELGKEHNLENLLRRCDELEGDFWIRVLYTHPLHITDGLLDILANGKHVVPYLDVPLQHISTNVLQRMARGMNGDKTRALLEGIRKRYPQMTIRTTFLTGFPGETEEDFQELLCFVKDFGFDRLGAFSFSPEEGTPAASMDHQVPQKLAEARKKQLLAAQQRISLERNSRFVGKEVPVLLEEPINSRKWLGRTMGDAPDVDQTIMVTLNKKREEPGFARAKIRTAAEYQLSGEELPNG